VVSVSPVSASGPAVSVSAVSAEVPAVSVSAASGDRSTAVSGPSPRRASQARADTSPS
jgi:hypothetical protein